MQNHDVNVLNALNQIETQHDVEKLVLDGLYIWPIMKIKLRFENVSRSVDSMARVNKITRVTGLLKTFCKIHLMKFMDRQKNDHFRKVDVLFLSDSTNRRMKNEKNEYVDIFTDLIAEKLSLRNISWLSLERCPANTILTPRAYKSIWISSQLLWLRVKLKLKKLSPVKIDPSLLAKIDDDLRLRGLKTFSISSDALTKEIYYIMEQKKTFLKFLRKASPKAVIQTDWYSSSTIALRLACKEYEIPFIDYQHGVQGSHHIAYGGWIKPFSGNAHFSIFPDAFFCWSGEDAKNILSWLPPSQGSAYNVGNIYLNAFKDGRLHLNEERRFTEITNSIDRSKTVCITLQPIYGLNESILKQIEVLGPDYFFWIRLHPLMLNDIEKYNSEIKRNFPWLKFNTDLATTTPLPLLLKKSFLHITYNSSVVIEAAFMGVPSIILDHDLGPGFFSKFIESKQAYLGPINKELIQISNRPVEENLDIVSVIESIISDHHDRRDF